MCENNRVHYGMKVKFVCLRITRSKYHHYAESIKRIYQLYSAESKSILSIMFYDICGTVGFQVTHFFFDDCENICTDLTTIIKSEI